MLEIAAILTLISGILSGLGHSIQRRSLDRLPELTPRTFYQQHFQLIIAILTTPLWLLGGVLSVSGGLLRWQAFSMGEVSILKPLTNINILVVVIIGVLFLGERVSRWEWTGITTLLGGVIVLSLAVEPVPPLTYHLPWYIFSTIICVTLVVILVTVGSRLGRTTREKELIFAMGAGILYGIATIFLKAMTLEVIQLLGGFSILDFTSLVVLTTRLSFWLYLSSSVIAYFLLQCAYSHRRASVAFPINNSLSTLVPIVIAVLVFGDVLITPIDGLLFFPISYLRIIGIFAVILGILFLRRFQSHTPTLAKENAGNSQNMGGKNLKAVQ
ncbi:MAG: hypothetical protein ACFE89_04930 [Candidatus Hodarchaeota archaeon]